MIKRLILFYALFLSVQIFAQVGIGQWRDHLPYDKTIAVTEGNDHRIYCATPYGAIYYDNSDNSITRLNSVNGLSDVNISTLNFDPETNYLIIAYINGNIDLIKDDQVFNISDIKRKSMVGSKRINRITFGNRLAYLSCDFGIVVLDLQRKEVKDTYYIGPDGSSIIVNDLAFDDTSFYAATEKGLYYARIDEPFLSNYAVWKKDMQIPYPDANYNTLALRKGHLYINMSNPVFATDTIFEKFQNQWQKMPSAPSGPNYRIKSYKDTLIIISEYSFRYYWNDMADSFIGYRYTFDGIDYSPQVRDMIFDKQGAAWIADNVLGLIKSWKTWAYERIKVVGPPFENAYSMTSFQSHLWVASGGIRSNWDNRYLKRGVYHFTNENWTTYNSINTPAFDTILDVMKVVVNPNNLNEVFIASWGDGLIKLKN